jgi:hypothetical protein
MQDMFAKGYRRSNREGTHRNKTHCPQGHPYTEENTAWTLEDTRRCKECNRIRGRRNYAKRAT